jgi:nitrous oxidase accessory protein NosD
MGGIQITNCTFENVGTGVSLPEGANVTMKGNKFKNVKTPVEFRKK